MGSASFFNNPNDYQAVDEGGEGSGFYDGPAYTEIDPVAIGNSVAAAAASAAASEVSRQASATEAAASHADRLLADADAATATAQAGIATTQAGIATTQAGIATTKAGDATTQAGIATTQAGIATTKASEAGVSASSALISASNADDSEANALTYKNNAQTSASNAATSETNAATSASQALASKNAAATSETNASTSAGTATTQAGIATTKAGEAATSASNASTSAGTATTQAGVATTKAGEASTSATNALASLNTFKGAWYGPLASNPTLDPLGAAIGEGDAYWNTTTHTLMIYNGSSWGAYSASAIVTTRLNASQNLDTIVTEGFYFAEANCTNQPVASTQYYLIVQKWPTGPNYVQQMAWDLTQSGGVWRRNQVGGVWGSWTRFADKATTIAGYGISDALAYYAGVPQQWNRQQYYAIGTISDNTTLTWNVQNDQKAKVTLGGNRTMNAVSNAVEGATYYLWVIQDATGTRTLSWTTTGSGSFDFGTPGAPTLTTTANKADLLCFEAVNLNSTLKLRYIGIQKGFA